MTLEAYRNRIDHPSGCYLFTMRGHRGLSWELEQIVEYQKLTHTIFIPLFTDPAKTMRAFQKIQQLTASSNPDKLSLRSIVDKIGQTNIRDEKLNEITDKVSVTTPALFLIEAGRPVPFDGSLHEAIRKVLDYIGIPYKRLTAGRLKAALAVFLAFSPFLLFGTYQVCEWSEMPTCVTFFEAFGVQIFLGLVAALIMLLAVLL